MKGHQIGHIAQVEISARDRDAADRLAFSNGTHIDGSCSVVMWSLPILKAMTERLDKVERELKEIKSGGSYHSTK